MFFLLYKQTDDGVFDDFPKISDHFPKSSENFPKLLVEFRIPGYPGPSKDQGTEVRLMRGKIFRGKIRM